MGRKLIVEVVEARGLLPKDGSGTSSPYVIVDFDGQRKRTQTAHRALNPSWNESLEFNLAGPVDMPGEPLEVDVLHDRRADQGRRSNFLGRIRLDSRQFVRKGEEALIHFPLESKSLFNWVRGEIGLRIYYVDEPEPEPMPDIEKADEPKAPENSAGDKRNEQPAPAPENGADPPLTPEKTDEQPAPSPENGADPPLNPEKSDEQPAPLPENGTGSAPESEGSIDSEKTKAQDSIAEPVQPPDTKPSEKKGPTVVPDEPWEWWLCSPDRVSEELPANGSVEKEQKEEHPPKEKQQSPTESEPPIPSPAPIHHRKTTPPVTIEQSSYDLVDKMQYLFVRVVRARSLPGLAILQCNLSVYGRSAKTTPARKLASFFEWDQTFAFLRRPDSGSEGSTLQASLWDTPNAIRVGSVSFDVSELPTRDPPDSPLATQWYRLEGREVRGGELMLAVWVGTQADESFAEAWKTEGPEDQAGARSKVYQSPKLWYLRATIHEVQDALTPMREAIISVRAAVGSQVLRTQNRTAVNGRVSWNEDLIFVVAEPFRDEQDLILWLECPTGKQTTVVGSTGIPIGSVERRVDDRKVTSRWLDLSGDGTKKRRRSGGRLHMRICLDGGYHVFDEPSHVSSDFRPTARQLWRPPLGIIELGIIGCQNLVPKAVDVYTVAKYGTKWARTRTARSDPTWNEQYTWPVYDPCTVLHVAVFAELDSARCRPLGKIRIRISSLESNRAYRGVYPLHLIHPSGEKVMGEIELAVRFARACPMLDLLGAYFRPTLPPMHHLHPIGPAQREPLRLAAARLAAAHLSRSEPPLRPEVVLFALEAERPRGFSMRRLRASWRRIVAALSWFAALERWVADTRAWRNPTTTALAHGVVVLAAWHPELVAPAVAIHLAAVGAWRYRRRSRGPTMGWAIHLAAEREDLDEEFDPVPSARGEGVVRARYERARAVGARLELWLGDAAAQAERAAAVVTWRDPRATGMFVAGCLVVAAALYVVPAKVVAVAAGFYFLRHPMFRDRRVPPAALNFFRRLPSLSDRII